MTRLMEVEMDKTRKRILDDQFDAFTMLAGGNLVSLYDMQSQVTRYGAAAVDLFNLPGEYIPAGAMDWGDYVHPEDRKRYYDIMDRLMACETRTYDLAYRVRTKDGNYRMFRAVGAVLRDAEGKANLIGGMMINEGLMENTDPVTVLRNQYGFFEDLGSLLHTGREVVVLLLGISRLGAINEVHGYGYGNRVLQEVAWLLQEVVGRRGSIYRMAGASFAIVTDSISDQEAAAMYDSIRLKLQRGIQIGEARHNLTANGGLLATRGQQMDERTVFACLNAAYQESRNRRYGALVAYTGGINYPAQANLERLNVIRGSMVEDCHGFYLLYQPVLDLRTERPIGVESLIRWQNAIYGEVRPLEFMPVLEQDYLFEELASWILHHAMEDGLAFLERDPSFLMGVNIAPAQLEDEYFADNVLYAMNRTHFPARNLCLELMRDCRLLEVERVKNAVAPLREKGVQILIDDFGAGYGSIDALKALDADFVKLDIHLMRGIEHNAKDREALLHLARMTEVYGPNVCAKGVENDAVRLALREFPIHAAQGDFFSGPLPKDLILSRVLGVH